MAIPSRRSLNLPKGWRQKSIEKVRAMSSRQLRARIKHRFMLLQKGEREVSRLTTYLKRRNLSAKTVQEQHMVLRDRLTANKALLLEIKFLTKVLIRKEW